MSDATAYLAGGHLGDPAYTTHLTQSREVTTDRGPVIPLACTASSSAASAITLGRELSEVPH
jgi:hypothetical protein